MTEILFLNHQNAKWRYLYNGKPYGEYKTKRDAAVGYVNNLLAKEPKYKPLFVGKSWAEIFKLVGIAL